MGLVQETHDVGSLFFWSTIRLKRGSEIYHAFPTHEIDPPYRWAVSHIFRIPFTTFGISVGHWHSATRTEEQAMLEALSGREVDTDEITKQKAREVVTDKSIDLDDEWKIVDALGLM
jgi:hypothetical protein